jgi:TfuA protein
MKTIVFFGPSIAEAEVKKLAAVTCAPPIKRGDLATLDDYDIFVILDGEFGQNLSVSPKEILSLLERGKTVIGASSMGALRASELDRSGMIGVGWVYDYFRRRTVRRDSDVALVYSPFDFKPMTVPMVDLEYWMEQASAAGLIAGRERSLLLKTARNIFFADRTPDALMQTLRGAVGDDMLDSLLAFSGGSIPNVKSADAAEAVRLGGSLQRP